MQELFRERGTLDSSRNRLPTFRTNEPSPLGNIVVTELKGICADQDDMEIWKFCKELCEQARDGYLTETFGVNAPEM